MGLTRFQAFRYAIVPEILPTFLSTTLFNFEGNLRYASILGYVGAGGLGIILNEQLGWREYGNVGTILVVLIVSVAIIESISEFARKKLQ
jgi:phosphonate transport system permease protein